MMNGITFLVSVAAVIVLYIKLSQGQECPFIPPTMAQASTSVPTVPGSHTCDPSVSYADSSCSGSTRTGARCSGDGYCRCHNLTHVDECTCLAIYGSCRVVSSSSAENAAALPYYQGSLQPTRSCVANDNCQYSVHVISVRETTPIPVSASVNITMSGDQNDTRPLILVLSSQSAIYWSLSIPEGITLEHIIVSSFYIADIPVTGVSSATSVERLKKCPNTPYSCSYRYDTVEWLQYLSNRYGPVSSWTNARRATSWNLQINRNSQEVASCPFVPPTTAQTTSTPIPPGSVVCNPSVLYADSRCSYRTRTGARCSEDGYCRCHNVTDADHVDKYTCLVTYGSCRVESSFFAENAAAVPYYYRTVQSTRSCVANDNCAYSVYVFSVYEAIERLRDRDLTPGPATVRITTVGEQNDMRPIILVLISSKPIHWSLSVPRNLTLEKVIVDSRSKSLTTVNGVSNLTSIEKLSSGGYCCQATLGYGNGYNEDTVKQLKYISNRYGPVSSWTSALRASSWNLQIRRNGCTPEPITSVPSSGISSISIASCLTAIAAAVAVHSANQLVQ